MLYECADVGRVPARHSKLDKDDSGWNVHFTWVWQVIYGGWTSGRIIERTESFIWTNFLNSQTLEFE